MESTGQRKPVFWHILRIACQFLIIFHKNELPYISLLPLFLPIFFSLGICPLLLLRLELFIVSLVYSNM